MMCSIQSSREMNLLAGQFVTYIFTSRSNPGEGPIKLRCLMETARSTVLAMLEQQCERGILALCAGAL